MSTRERRHSRTIVMTLGIALLALAHPAVADSSQRIPVTEQRNAAVGFAINQRL